ncbi:MAG: hypothetical protein B6D35_14370 [Candidatus Brocadia sp. UTAMX2]|jgi:hypothetical protein|nr:MAG: hypothetical protein B6D35_14370 [Candidatus Brocadia sp. UTAMX2]
MKTGEYTCITGLWDGGKKRSIEEFLRLVKALPVHEKSYQLHQTWSECKLAYLDPTFQPDPRTLEQYRAFCDDWELWIRNSNSQALRFRCIIKGINLPSDAINVSEGFTIDNAAARVQTRKYPLWGEPLLRDDTAGWYTEQIPQILRYPVDFPENTKNKRVYVTVEHFLRDDGTTDIVRYTGLGVW